jgi:hypothetical protein
MNLDKQRENVNILLGLIKENPNLPIVPMVATECVSDDSYGYWMAEWSKAEVTKYWCSDERIWEYDYSFDELIDYWIDDNFEDYATLSDEELKNLAIKTVNGYEWVDAIVVYIESI